MPRILRIINRLNLGGPTFNAALLTKYIGEDFETLLVAGQKQKTEASSDFIVTDLGLNYVSIPDMQRSINPVRDIRAYRKIRKLIREFKPDIVHTHASKAGTLGRLAAIHAQVPVIIHTFHGHIFHSYFHPVKTRVYKGIERYLARKSSAIIAISERQKAELGTRYRICPPSKIHVIPLGFDLSRFRNNMDEKRRLFREKYMIDDHEIAIGIIGRLVPVKNHALFIRSAAKTLISSSRKLRFFIIGDGEERNSILKLCHGLRMDYTWFPAEPRKATITFCGWEQQVDKVIAGLDVVVLTSLNEGTPVSLIEAQAGNKPVVTTNVGGIENIVLPDKTALLVDQNTEEAFSVQLLRITEDDTRREMMGRKGWEVVEHRFHYTRLVKETRELYLTLLGAKRKKTTDI